MNLSRAAGDRSVAGNQNTVPLSITNDVEVLYLFSKHFYKMFIILNKIKCSYKSIIG